LQCPGKLAVKASDILGMLQHGKLSPGVIVDGKIMTPAAMALLFFMWECTPHVIYIASASALVVSYKIKFDV